MIPLPRTVKLGSVGLDVEAHGRAMHRYLKDGQLAAYMAQRDSVRRTFGVGKRTLAKQCAAKAGLPQYGVVGPHLYAAMRHADAYDLYADDLLLTYERLHTPLVEPVQGWESLRQDLWHLYSIGRQDPYVFTDLGTYNPASTLPGGGPSDHSVWPARAFDLGISPATGWANLAARRYFNLCVDRKEVEYVICGTRIWSQTNGLHEYTAGGHDNHIHVSGRH